jgi:hypothetical protein
VSRGPLATRLAPRRSIARERTAAGADRVVARAAYRDQSWEVVRWSAQPPTVFTTGEVAAMAMYAGCGVGDIANAPVAVQIVERMMAEAVPLSSPPAC